MNHLEKRIPRNESNQYKGSGRMFCLAIQRAVGRWAWMKKSEQKMRTDSKKTGPRECRIMQAIVIIFTFLREKWKAIG